MLTEARYKAHKIIIINIVIMIITGTIAMGNPLVFTLLTSRIFVLFVIDPQGDTTINVKFGVK